MMKKVGREKLTLKRHKLTKTRKEEIERVCD